MQAIESAGYQPGKDVAIALDVAASELYQDGKYVFKKGDGSTPDRRGDGGALHPVGGPLPDRVHRGRPGGGRLGRVGAADREAATSACSSSATTSSAPTWTGWRAGIESGIANAILIKVNQIGTLTETLQCIELAKGSSYGVVISHRSGETEDTFIADLAVATGAAQIKTGSASRTDRVAKYNQLLRIAEELGEVAHYPGRDLYPL